MENVTIKSLIEAIDNTIMNDDRILTTIENGTGFIKQDHDDYPEDVADEIEGIFAEIEGMLNTIMIMAGGRPNNSNMTLLKSESVGKYHITRGEYDSFGWLTGVLNTPKGKFIYG